MMADGATIPYDRLVVSPGIDLIWDSVPGYSEEAAGGGAACLEGGAADAACSRKRSTRWRSGQQVVMVMPPNPYRCPLRGPMSAHR
jgi:sulfide dehydrogenase [flavocytochrome c] flavoprotein subunit